MWILFKALKSPSIEWFEVPKQGGIRNMWSSATDETCVEPNDAETVACIRQLQSSALDHTAEHSPTDDAEHDDDIYV